MKSTFCIAILTAVSLFTSCNKKAEEVSPEDPSAKSKNLVCLEGKKTYVKIDASTNEGLMNSPKSFTCGVISSLLTDTIYLDIKSKEYFDHLYITKCEDNTHTRKITPNNTLKTDDGLRVTSSQADYSYHITGNAVKELKLKIPFTIRNSNAAIADVYSIWFTLGKGDFTIPTHRKVLGPIKVFLKYSAGLTFSSITDSLLGDQNSEFSGFIATKGYLGPVSLAGTVGDSAFKSVDINMVALNTTSDSLGTDLYFISPRTRAMLQFKDYLSANANVTKYALFTGSQAFNNINGLQLFELPKPTEEKVKIEEGKMYSFYTEDGRNGVIEVKSINSSLQGKTAAVNLKVLD